MGAHFLPNTEEQSGPAELRNRFFPQRSDCSKSNVDVLGPETLGRLSSSLKKGARFGWPAYFDEGIFDLGIVILIGLFVLTG